jgi:hypothetical protein
MAGKLKWAVALGVGYVLGARAGRERYEQIAEQARRLSNRPEVQKATGKVRDQLNTGVERVSGSVGKRLQEARTSSATAQQSRPEPSPAAPEETAGFGQPGTPTGVDSGLKDKSGLDPTRGRGRGQPG